ncbi:hypothetical protein FLONG3_5817 [Fusarium longipes]|uniref:Uncharacterized protein n=1 Tax=Fusarium longipes TaxID=694270 RepID=A0A395SRQ0_9HYPO|nr:hypothetical protein FLONG3_5817 [Fusarium longipes]
MCQRSTKKYICNRCSNDIFIDTPQQIICKWHRRKKHCGRLELVEIMKCEPALCTRCSSFPLDSPLPFSGTSDNPPIPDHEVEQRCEAHMIGEKEAPMVRVDAVMKARKTDLVGTESGADPLDHVRNFKLGLRLSRILPEMKLIAQKD